METLVLVVHVLAAMAMIGLILMQQGKGAEMGASFGAGASQTLFGSQGAGNFFSRMTAFIAIVFFVTSFALALIAKQQVTVGDNIGIPSVEEQDSDVPTVEDSAEPESEVPVIEESTEAPAGSEVPAVDSPGEIPQPSADAAGETEADSTEAPPAEEGQ